MWALACVIVLRFFTEAKKCIPHLDIQAGFGVYPFFYSIRMGGGGLFPAWVKRPGCKSDHLTQVWLELYAHCPTCLLGGHRGESWPVPFTSKVELKKHSCPAVSHLTCFSGCSGSRRVLTELLVLLYPVPYTIALHFHALVWYVFTSDACVPSVVITYWYLNWTVYHIRKIWPYMTFVIFKIEDSLEGSIF